MDQRNFTALLANQWQTGKFLCVGLDPVLAKIPKHLQCGWVSFTLYLFCKTIVDAVSGIVCCFKPNIAFFEAHGTEGLETLSRLIDYIHGTYPHIPVILDAKRGDIGKTNEGYVTSAFTILKADAITLNPYLGGSALGPFLEDPSKNCIILCRTSNPGAGEFQDLVQQDGRPLYQHVADRVANMWNVNGNCAVVVGATAPEQLGEVRRIVGDLPILIPGIGTQGGDLQATVLNGRTSSGSGMIINASSSVIHASQEEDFTECALAEATRLHEEINEYRLQEVAS